MIRSTLLAGYSELTRSLGAEPQRLLRRSGINPRLEHEPDSYIPFSALCDLLERTADVTACDSFGLRLSAAQGIRTLGPIGFAMQSSATFRDATAEYQRFQTVHMVGAHGELQESRGLARWVYHIDEPGLLGTRQKVGQALGLACNVFRGLLGPEWSPAQIDLAQSAPSDLAEFRRLLGAPVMFNAESDCIAFPLQTLERPIERSDPELRRLLDRYLMQMQSNLAEDRCEQVRQAIRSCLSRQDCSVVEVANMLSVPPRTLQRQMAAEDVSFSQLLEQVRRETAERHLTSSQMPLTQLAAILGYSELSAFSRAFRRWHGCSPKQWQRFEQQASN